MAALLEVEGLKAYYGQTQALHDVSFSLEPAASPRCWAPTAPARPRRCAPSAAWCAPRAPSRFDGRPIAGKATEEIVRLGVGHVPEGRGTFTNLSVDENLRVAAYTRSDKTAVERDREMVYEYFPDPQGASRPAGRHAVGRRAADAGDQPRADAGSRA